MIERLGREWFARPAPEVARDLIGHLLVHELPGRRVAGRIVETEAYLGVDDAASHAAIYRSGVAKMSRQPGVIYMYIAYGVHAMFNVVTDEPGVCGAVLIRSMEPVEGTDQMRSRSSNLREHLLASGPGRVCKAMGFGPTDDGRDLDSDVEIRIEFGRVPAIIGASTRIGITRNEHALLRYYDPESKSVSGPARLRGPNPEQVFHAD